MAGQVILTTANQIALAENATNIVDELYKTGAKSYVLDDTSGLATLSANGKQINIPKISMDGLGNHNRNGNYVMGDVVLEWETKIPDYDRSKLFAVDAMDDAESMGVAFGALAAQFIRTKVVPEMDAFTFAKLAGKAGTVREFDYSGPLYDQILDDMLDANAAMEEGRILFVTPTIMRSIAKNTMDVDRSVLSAFSQIIEVPQSRFYSAIQLLSGSDAEKAGGYLKTGDNLNFMIVDKASVIKFTKHNPIRIGAPNVTNDMYQFSYRIYAIVDVYDNKTDGDGIYVSKVPAA